MLKKANMEDPHEIAESLNHLITIAIDGQNGYATAAEHAKDPMLKAILLRYSAERAEFATELRALARAAGTDPEDSSGPVAALHRIWIDIKTAVSNDDNKAIINECITGDNAVESAYETELNETIFTDEQPKVVLRHLKSIRDTLSSLKLEAAKLP